MKYDLTTFGEAMVRISIRPGRTLANADRADLHCGGAEANTAVALARLGMKTAWVSRLGDNALGRRVAGDVARHGVDVSGVVWSEKDRVGTYFVEFAAAPGAASVLYDRKHSAASKLDAGDLPWDLLLDTRILHLTGITPALSRACRQASAAARARARERRVPVSFDVNYRSRLWSRKTAARVLTPLLRKVALLIVTEEDAATLFGIGGAAEDAVCELRERFRPGAAVMTLGARGAIAWDGKEMRTEPGFGGIEAIDRVGAGDAFAAGLIFGWLGGDLSRGLKYGMAASALKMGQHGDQFWGGRAEVEQLLQSRSPAIRR
jgi:2-dehydro-3-deoxygluconokinase